MFVISNRDLLITVSIIGYVCNKQLGQTYNCGYNRLCLQ